MVGEVLSWLPWHTRIVWHCWKISQNWPQCKCYCVCVTDNI